MKLTVKGPELRDAAAWAAKIAPSNPPQPVMAGVKLTAGDDLTLSATDYETFGTARCTSTTQDAGSVVVSGRLLAAVAKIAGNTPDVTLVSDGAELEIRAGRASWKLPTMEADLWPQFPTPGEPLGRIDGAHLEDTLSRVAVAADDGTLNQDILRGVYLELGEALTLTATNTFRMARLTVEWTAMTSEPAAIIVPATVLKHLGTDGEVTISTDGSVIGLTTRQRTVIGRLIAGKYKDCEPIFQAVVDNAIGTVTVDVQELRAAIESAAILTGEADHLALDFSDQAVEVSKVSSRSDKGDGDASASVDMQGSTGEILSIDVKANYIKDALFGLHSPSALFTFARVPRMRTSPIMLQPCDDGGNVADDYRHVLVPIKRAGQ